VHHLAFDGWSETLLVDDLARAYAGEPLRPPPLTYDSYSRWDRARGPRLLQTRLPFWRERLRDTPPPFLPKPSDAGQAARRETTLRLDRGTVRALTRAAARHGGPPGAALVACAGRALAEVTGADDLCLGTVTAGRSAAALEPVVGCFVNPLVLPLTGVRRRGGAELPAHAAESLTSAMAHADLAFDELVRELGPDRSRHPWFQAWAVLQHQPPHTWLDERVRLESVRVPPPCTSLELVVEAFPQSDGGWEVVAARREDGIDEATAGGLLCALGTAFAELATQP
jgi:hypothetical protein